MFQPIPAPGYVLISGRRKPPASMGTHIYVQLRNGWVPEDPWPIEGPRWKHDGGVGDIVAIRRVV